MMAFFLRILPLTLLASCATVVSAVPEITAAGGNLTQLTRTDVAEWAPSLSNDGKNLVFVRGGVEPDRKKVQQKLRAVVIGIGPNQGTGERIFTSDSSWSAYPSYVPDDSSLLMVSNTTGRWTIVRTIGNTPGSAVRVVVPADAGDLLESPSASPDGKRIYFSALINGKWSVASMSVDGTGLTILCEGRYPALSPDGKLLAFVREIGGQYQLHTVEAETGGGLIQVTTFEDYATGPSWSPDGKYIAFVSNMGWNTVPGGTRSFTRNVYAVAKTGTGLVQLTAGSGASDWVHWGKDNHIYFTYASSGRGNTAKSDIWSLQPKLH